MVWPLILFFQFYEIRLTLSASQLSLPQITNYKESSHPRGRANGAAVKVMNSSEIYLGSDSQV